MNNPITQREVEVLLLVSEGNTKKQISEKLNITYHTVDSHVKNIYAKLQVNCVAQAVMKAMKEGLI
ncbi:MAG: LuxR C-terminal-related transcriptional regulator [Bacteroidales bacterium]|nr:LuxR C-terminal-related transcriptional regulator [Bacteroidales bacterium]MCF8454811.1 LuxR C-terminal-related transcriptional regulator [Bacteroidales bacterium]